MPNSYIGLKMTIYLAFAFKVTVFDRFSIKVNLYKVTIYLLYAFKVVFFS